MLLYIWCVTNVLIFFNMYACTEEWNGSAWSETTNLPYPLMMLNQQSAGTQNAAIIAGGYTGTGSPTVGSGSDAIKRHALAWDGLSYNHVGSMANERGSGGLVGTMNAALAQGGNNMVLVILHVQKNGMVVLGRMQLLQTFQLLVFQTVGTSNDAMHVLDHTNSPAKVGCTDFYNGMSWSLVHKYD